MIDTIKFDIPLELSEDELGKISWSTTTEKERDGRITCFYNLKSNARIGEPFISYVKKKDNPSIYWLRVEVSLPKFRFGTNYYELDDTEMKHTLEELKKYICTEFRISSKKLPPIDSWRIKKLHICKNFNADQEIQDYLQNASRKVLQKRKTTTYKANGSDEIQTVVWQTKSAKEKLYDKHAEISENKGRHKDADSLLQQSKGCLRYEKELSKNDIDILHDSYSTTQILSSNVVIPLLNKSIERLNLDFNIQRADVSRILKAIEADKSINTRTKNSLIAFVSKLNVLGEHKTKSSYSDSGYYKVKSMYDDFLFKNSKKLTQNLKKLNVETFDYAKVN